MKDRHIVIKLLYLLSIILLYYIAGKNSLFLYVITLSLYNIYLSCFTHISIKEKLKEVKDNYSKFKIYIYTVLCISIVCLLFITLSILIGNATNILLDIKNASLPYLIMSISVITKPLVKLSLEYLESYNKPKLSNRLLNAYYVLDIILLLIIALFSIRIFKFPINISLSLIYLSKIISLIFVLVVIYLIFKKENIIPTKTKTEDKIDYKKEIKSILQNNSHKSIIDIVTNSYSYISIIIVYVILSTKYSYSIETIEKEITFIYLFGLTIINFIIDTVLSIATYNEKRINIISYILKIFRFMLTISIILAVTSPLVCKIIFNDSSNAIYLMMLNFLSIFIALHAITFENIKSKKIIYLSLIIGIISKIILIVPLINSFYRMGYNLIYGDIISTIISMFISIIINYIYLKNKNRKEKTLEKIMKTLYESILLCIMLIILQFIVPIKTKSYIMSVVTFMFYITASLMFLEMKRKKRG